MEDIHKKSKRILVTGGLGYIGSHTIVELNNQEYLSSIGINEEYEIAIVDNCSNSSPTILELLQKLTGKNIKFYDVDILNYDDLETIFKQNHFDTIIHFAGKKSVAESVANPIIYYRNNVAGTINLIDLSLKYNCNNFIFSSSNCVYGNRDDQCTEDEENLQPINPYGRSKLEVEKILREISKAHTQFRSVILRYCNPVAAHKTGLIGENPKGVPANLFPVLENHIKGKIPQVSIFGNDYDTPDGTGIRDYVHVADIAQGHVLALQCFNKERSSLLKNNVVTYNMGTDNGYSVLEVVTTYINSTGAKINYKIADRRPGDAARGVPNSSKIKRELGWSPKTTLKEMCIDSYNFIKMNPDGI